MKIHHTMPYYIQDIGLLFCLTICNFFSQLKTIQWAHQNLLKKFLFLIYSNIKSFQKINLFHRIIFYRIVQYVYLHIIYFLNNSYHFHPLDKPKSNYLNFFRMNFLPHCFIRNKYNSKHINNSCWILAIDNKFGKLHFDLSEYVQCILRVFSYIFCNMMLIFITFSTPHNHQHIKPKH